MAEEAVARTFSDETRKLAEQIASLTLKQAQELVDCLKATYGIEPAGGGVMVAVLEILVGSLVWVARNWKDALPSKAAGGVKT